MQKKLTRSNNKMIAGVCAGVAKFFGLDVTLVRIVWAASILLGGAGIILYLICMLLMPSK